MYFSWRHYLLQSWFFVSPFFQTKCFFRVFLTFIFFSSFQDCEFLCLLSSFLNKDAYFSFNFVRELVVKDVTNQKLWNIFNAIITSFDDTRHNKFLLRYIPQNLKTYFFLPFFFILRKALEIFNFSCLLTNWMHFFLGYLKDIQITFQWQFWTETTPYSQELTNIPFANIWMLSNWIKPILWYHWC